MRSLLFALSMIVLAGAARAQVTAAQTPPDAAPATANVEAAPAATPETPEQKPAPSGDQTAAKPADATQAKPAAETDTKTAAACTADPATVLGVSRTVTIDTTGGPRFGDQYPPETLLEPGEVVLTFDDGPHPTFTKEILDALAAQCTKATFFHVGQMTKQYPDIARAVAAAGHTVGTHTWSHPNIRRLSLKRAKSQIEQAIATEESALPGQVAPFFRFPYLSDSKAVLKYLEERNIAVFSIDVDSFDYRTRKPDRLVRNVMQGLEKAKKGIILFHDIHAWTAKALPDVLKQLKEKGYKVVHVVPKSPLGPALETAADETKPEPPKKKSHLHRQRRAQKSL